MLEHQQLVDEWQLRMEDVPLKVCCWLSPTVLMSRGRVQVLDNRY